MAHHLRRRQIRLLVAAATLAAAEARIVGRFIMTTPHPEFIEAKLVAVGRELDVLSANGRQLSRRMIIDLAYRRGFQDGVDFEAREWTTNLSSTLAKLKERE